MTPPLLRIDSLSIAFRQQETQRTVVDSLSLQIEAGETLALVGESGSGKSVTSLAVMGLLDESAKIEGSVKLHGTEILGKSDAWMSKIRGKKVAMVFQDPLSALTPVYTIGDRGSLDHSPEDEQDRGARASD